MTDGELEEIAASIINSLGWVGWRCHSVGLVQPAVNGHPNGDETEASAPVAWFHFIDEKRALRHFSLELERKDRQWIEGELRRLLVAPPAGVSGTVEAGDVSGLVVAVNTGVINRNFYGGNFYQTVQLHVLKDEARTPGRSYPLPESAKPYKGLAPYTALDRQLFKGRDAEIKRAVGLILQQQVLIIHGAPGVGKTSLLSAGVVPRLVELGALVIQIQDYVSPAQSIFDALKAYENELPFGLSEKPNLSALVGALLARTGGTLVLAFDQFELLFEPSVEAERRREFLGELSQALKAHPQKMLKVIVSVRDEAQGQLAELEQSIRGALHCRLSVPPLDRTEAVSAVLEPLETTGSPFGFSKKLVEDRLIPDLAAENPTGDVNFVHPPHLQIVCTWFYERALGGGGRRVVDEEVYKNDNGADGIIASYLRETLPAVEGERKAASRVLAAMASPTAKRWVTAVEISVAAQSMPPGEVEEVLGRLVTAGLVVQRTTDQTYSFVSPSTAGLVLQLAGPDALARTNAEGELERIWLSWLARAKEPNPWASREQLRYLAAAASLTPQPVRTLLLLRSATERDEPARTYLEWLAAGGGRALVAQLEGLPLEKGERPDGQNVLSKAAALVGLPSDGAAVSPDGAGAAGSASAGSNSRPEPSTRKDDETPGPLAENALTSRDPAARQTSALALSVLGRARAAERLRLAMRKHPALRKAHAAELLGALLDADPGFAGVVTDFNSAERARVWLWRARRRVRRAGGRVTRLAGYAAVGGGLGMVLLRVATVKFANIELPGTSFSVNFLFGAAACGLLTLGAAVADSVWPLLPGGAAPGDAGASASAWTRLRRAALAAAAGALGFGFANFFISSVHQEAVTTGANILSGLAAGLGLSLSLAGLGQARRPFQPAGLPPRLGLAVFGFAVAQLIYETPVYVIIESLFDNCGKISECPNFETVKSWLPQLTNQDWMLVDAALAGLFMSLGTMAGLWAASRQQDAGRG